MKRLLIFSVCAFCALTAYIAPAQQTKILTGDKANEYGVVYSLPETELVVDASCSVTVRVPGPYRIYAKRYLGAEAPIQEFSSTAKLENADMWIRGVASDSKFLMQMKPGALASLNVSNSGMLLAINAETELEAESVLEMPENTPVPDIDEYLKYVDADYLASLSSAKRAQILAQTIMEIRESRLSLSRGTAETMPADGKQLELMLNGLEQQENALMRAFNGYEHTSYQAHRYTCLPDSTDTDTQVLLFRLSDNTGFCDKDDYSGEEVYLSFSLKSTPELPLDLQGKPKELPKNAVIYSLPGTAEVALVYKGEQAGSSEQFNFAQFGTQFGLDPKLFTDKRKPYMASFDPATGALMSITEIAK
ncbi:MAG: DUF4831 family protein [Prevotella sp.]|nr:DUF4831 family protein [Prevotella sp.]MCM1075415.1 DUF4831 family protein [Ruminococcus sp.]